MTRSDANLSGRYRLESRIAVGGMGDVWRATDEVLGRPVAVKLLHPADEYQYADAVARFRDEARHVGSLSHPGIAQVYDFGEANRDHPPFLVMELVDGPSLAGLLSQGPLSPARTMDIVAQTADALHAAHATGLVHRDIKPGNLLVGPRDQLKIVDFGIAQAASSAAVTGTGAVIGSPAYLAPERVRGGAATPASDLYSLGIVAYECLVGSPPFSGAGMSVAHAHVYQPMPPLPPGVPAGIAPLVEQLTAKDPAARPASAADVAAHARRLRDSLRSNGTMVLPVMHPNWEPYGPAGDRDYAGGSGRHRVLADLPPVEDPSWPDRAARGPGPRRFGLVATLVAVALVVLAGLIGWQAKSVLDAGQNHQAGSSPAASTSPNTQSSSPTVGMVMVAASQMQGQDMHDVRKQLLQLGLQPKLVWQQPSDQYQPGTVISVTPSGPVQPGSVITITVAGWCGGDGGGCGNGNGNGGGGGN
jgi:serine/threonine-protein kinase